MKEEIVTIKMTRREMLQAGLTAATLATLGLPESMMPAVLQGETAVPFTDIPANMNFTVDPNAPNRFLDIRTIDGPYTPKEKFFATQHHGQPEVDPATFRLKVDGTVNKTLELTMDEIRKRPSVQVPVGFECSGNSRGRLQGLASAGLWTGTRLKDLLNAAGVKSEGKEVVFFGVDHGEIDVPFRGQTYKVDQHFGRSITIENAMKPEPILAYAMNGDPLTKHQGFPLRLIMPGWYGVANVKWLTQIHVQETRFVGHYQARWYLTLRSEMVGGQEVWKETEISRMRPKSVISRVVKSGNHHVVHGFALNDGSPLKSVEVKIDEGSWAPATMDKSNTQFGWKLFTYVWEGATPGEHTLVSKATDANGAVQPTQAELTATKKTFLEDNSQFPRKVMIS
jgi:DMSO/TMAO reductase YedYZ molybdopterin-dependent catalytic subunit